MILVDLNQVLFLGLRQQSAFKKGTTEIDTELVRHIVLNILRSYNKQFRQKYGELILCCDSKKYWRRDVFPLYKSNRKKDRDASSLDWASIFDSMNIIRDELKKNYVHKVIDVEGAEADDIIAVLTKNFHKEVPILIVSQDKDFIQLQKYDNVDHYNPITKKYVSCKDPARILKEHILKGDRGDGIPNFLSEDNTLDEGIRQKVLTTTKLNSYLETTPAAYTGSQLRGYTRNRMLIDFDYIPEELQTKIIDAYSTTEKHTRQAFMNYMIKTGLTKLLSDLEDF